MFCKPTKCPIANYGCSIVLMSFLFSANILMSINGQLVVDSSNRNTRISHQPATVVIEGGGGRAASEQVAVTDPLLAQQPQQQQVSLYKQPNSWLVALLKEFFSDIDWQTIDEASEQVAKFIRKVDRLVGSIRSVLSKATNGDGFSERSDKAGDSSPSSRWWSSSGSGSLWSSGIKASQADEVSNIKGMLERVACFVGYLRLMNLSNEALAELDASRVVSSLFGASQRRNSTGVWSWFG